MNARSRRDEAEAVPLGSDDLATRLPHLTHIPLQNLPALTLTGYTRDLLAQVARPRPNLGGGGPPGRAD